jgi:archaellum component FlaC
VADKANVASIEALDRFRSNLVVYLERVNSILDEVSEEVKRTRIWLQTEQKLKLTQEMKRRNRELEMLEAEMFSARLSSLKTAKTGAQMQINKKRREIRSLEETMKAVAGWARNFDSTVEVEARKVEKLRFLLDSDMKHAVNFLSESIRLLDDYSSGGMPASSSPPPARSENDDVD